MWPISALFRELDNLCERVAVFIGQDCGKSNEAKENEIGDGKEVSLEGELPFTMSEGADCSSHSAARAGFTE